LAPVNHRVQLIEWRRCMSIGRPAAYVLERDQTNNQTKFGNREGLYISVMGRYIKLSNYRHDILFRCSIYRILLYRPSKYRIFDISWYIAITRQFTVSSQLSTVHKTPHWFWSPWTCV